MKLSGAEIFVESLKKEGVNTIFGYPGGVVLPIFDVLYNEKSIKVILPRHEQAAVHMADGYARSTGKVGVALATSGPGATNTVTGIATAYMDSIPIVVFTGQVPTPMIGVDAFQEADIVGITRPCTKYNYLVKNVNDLAYIIKEAFYIASKGRPGPVLVDIPRDIIASKTDYVYPETINIRSYNPTYIGNRWQIRKAAEAIVKAKKPIIYAGGGVILSNASDELRDVAKMTDIPVTLTLMGLGGFPGDDPLFLGMLGMHGTYVANMAIHNADLIIAVGARFDDRVTGRVKDFAPEAKIIHIDIDPTSIRKSVHVDIPIVGDVKLVLTDLIKGLKTLLKEENEVISAARKQWKKTITDWKSEHPLWYEWNDEVIKPQFVVEKIYELTKGDAIIATEVGQNQMWAAQFYKFIKPRTWLTSGGLGTMGYGFPAALGAQAANPDKIVFDIAGDGSIQMNIQELATAVIEQLNVKVAILNNTCLGMVRQWQELFYGERYSSSILCEESPDFIKLAEAYGAVGLRATTPSEVEPVLKEAIKVKKPVLMDFRIDKMEKVFPMVPAGGAINEMILPNKKEKKSDKLKAVK